MPAHLLYRKFLKNILVPCIFTVDELCCSVIADAGFRGGMVSTEPSQWTD